MCHLPPGSQKQHVSPSYGLPETACATFLRAPRSSMCHLPPGSQKQHVSPSSGLPEAACVTFLRPPRNSMCHLPPGSQKQHVSPSSGLPEAACATFLRAPRSSMYHMCHLPPGSQKQHVSHVHFCFTTNQPAIVLQDIQSCKHAECIRWPYVKNTHEHYKTNEYVGGKRGMAGFFCLHMIPCIHYW